MAELNFGLLNPPGSQSIGNAFVTGMDQASAARAQENQNALAQYTLSKAKREDQVKNQLLAELRAATTPEQQQQAYINAGMGKEAAEMQGIGLKNIQTQAETEYKRAQTGVIPGQMARDAAATAASNATLMKERQAFANQATRDLAVNPSDDNIRAYGQDAVLKELYTKEEADSVVAKMLAIPMDQRAAQFKQAGAAAAAPQVTPAEINTMTQLGIPLTPEGYAAFRASQQPGKLLTPDEFTQQLRLRQAGRPPPQPRAEAAPRTQQITLANGDLGVVNMDTGVITPTTLAGVGVKGKPSAFAEKTAAQRAQLGNDLNFAISQLTDITKDGGLIDQSTGSGAGRLIDLAAGFGGKAMPGAIAIGKLKPVADLLLKMVPRFEGPQSNADTRSYNEAAGQVADPTLPTEIRKAAGKTVLRIMIARKNQFATADMAAEGAPPAAALSLQEQAAAEIVRREKLKK